MIPFFTYTEGIIIYDILQSVTVGLIVNQLEATSKHSKNRFVSVVLVLHVYSFHQTGCVLQ